MIVRFGDYELDDDRSRHDLERVQSWLRETYWSPGISLEKVIRAAENSSAIVGAYFGQKQVAYLRVISDRTSFAWLCDVIVAQEYRGQGLGHALVGYILKHPEYQGLRRWLLATRDAHGVYSDLGFEPLSDPERWMIYLPKAEDPTKQVLVVEKRSLPDGKAE